MGNCNHCEHCEHEHEEENLKKDIIKLIISLIIFIIAIIVKIPNVYKIWIYIVAYIIAGQEVLLKSIKNIFKGDIFDENFLMSVATIGAFIINEPIEAVCVMIFYNIGELFEDIAQDKSKKSIIKLMKIKPKIANLKYENEVKIVEPESLKIGDIIIVKPGEKIPVDGVIINGETTINTSALTGESIPRRVKTGEYVMAGSINENNLIEVKVEKEYKDTQINKIIELVKNCNENKSKTEVFITKFAKIYTPVVVVLAVCLAFIPPAFMGFKYIEEWVKRALVFLVTSCPCALVLSVPLGFFAGIGRAGREGVLVKGSNYLNVLIKAKTIVLDKTGTITKGNFEVTKTILTHIETEKELLRIAAIAESMSNHPIAKSIIKKANELIDINDIKEFKEFAGMGVKVKYKNDEILVGNSKLLDTENIDFDVCDEVGALAYVVKNKTYLGCIIISDALKEDSKDAIKGFEANGIDNIYMLTGDSIDIAENVANNVGIKKYYANLLPVEKVEKMQEIKKKYDIIIAIGDGINDSPLLALSDIGVSIGNTGADLAIETSDIVIMDGKLSSFNKLIKTAKITNKIVKQNICFAIGIKILVLVLGAIGVSTMWEAIFADVGVMILTILNSLRILKK